MSDEHQTEAPGMPSGPPGETGPVGHRNKLEVAANISPLELASEIPARIVGMREARAEKAAAVEKPPRQKAAGKDASAVGDAGQQLVAKAPRAPRKRAAKATTTPAQDQPTAGLAASDSGDIPPLTAEAASFLAREDSTMADLLKLGPDSLAFVRHHNNLMQRIEASSKVTNAYLMANSRPVSPAYQKFADALILHGRAKAGPSSEPAVIEAAVPDQLSLWTVAVPSYGPKATAVAAYAPVSVRLRKLDIVSEKVGEQEQSAQVLADTKLAHRVVGTAQGMMSAQIDDVTPREAAEMVAGDLENVRAIKEEKSRQLALNAMAESAHAQPRYKAEFERQAPELITSASEAGKALAPAGVKTKGGKLNTPEVENSIEPSQVRQMSTDHQPAQNATAAVAGPANPAVVGRSSKGLLSAIGSAAQKAGAWLSDRDTQGLAPTAPVKVSLDKSGDPTSQTKPPVAQVDDKSTVVPKEVARHYLKVEQEFYFPDRTHAFSDRGNKLATRGAHPDVVRSLVEIAKARGWDNITVKGSEQFRRSAWLEAAQNGMKVVGYKPTDLDLAELANRPANNTVEKGVAREKNPAPAQTVGGVTAKPADAAIPMEPEVKEAPVADTLKLDPELAKKAKAFEENKPSFVVKKYPDLVGAYGIVEAAKAFAAEKLPEGAREEFVGMARRHVMQKIITGETVKGPKIYMAPAKSREADVGEQAKAAARGDLDLGKSPREKEVTRER